MEKIPCGKSGDWSIERFTVSESEASFFNMRASFRDRRFIKAGEYTRLKINGSVMMSDTPSELDDHKHFVNRARGNVLITGLGLGLVLAEVASKPEVIHVTVIEQSEDVLALVAEFYKKKFGDKITIIHADAYTWKPPRGTRYDCAWHDIWLNICADNWKLIQKIESRYRRYVKWQDCWCKEEVKCAR